MSLMLGIHNDAPNPVQSHEPAIWLPHEAIGNVVTKTNTLILEHRDWLDNMLLEREKITTTTAQPSLITPAPSLDARHGRRQIAVLPECSAVSSSLASELSLVSSTCEVRSTSLSAALLNAESAFTSAQLSAAIALSTASVSALADISMSASIASSSLTEAQASASSSASSAISSAQSSASLAIASMVSSALNSATLAIRLAQSSASISVQSANNALTSVQNSAGSVIASASSVAQSASSAVLQAQATASSAIQSAQASVAVAKESATATRVAAMNTTILALAVTFSVIGSALISVLLYYLISRYRRHRRERKQSELKESIHRVRHESYESLGPSLSAFPMPVGRSKWMSRAGRESGSRPETAQITGGTNGTGGMMSGSATLTGQNSQIGSVPLRGNGIRDERQTWAPNAGNGGMQGMDFAFTHGSDQSSERISWASKQEGRQREGPPPSMKPVMTRKNALTYDPEHPERPPKFTTWLEESFRSVSPFPDMDGEEKEVGKARKSFLGEVRRSMGDGKRLSLMQRRRSRDIGTAF